jgi:hypothetical protein
MKSRWPVLSLTREERTVLNKLAQRNFKVADVQTYYLAMCQDGRTEEAAEAVRSYLKEPNTRRLIVDMECREQLNI